ncbi:MAG: HEAT repeat domain-containing protein [Pseudobdellovibrio sp.]
MRLKYSVVVCCYLLLCSLISRAASIKEWIPGRPTVCTVTINSNHESQAFERSLKPQGFQFIELTEATQVQGPPATNADWFSKSCKSGIRCDVLIISGHFGGSFFTDDPLKPPLRLPLSELTQHSCQQDCSGILDHPKEVFLFGCNTLAGKEKDSRTMSEYIRVLTNDGFSINTATQVAAARYSPFGGLMGGRMVKAFNQVPIIYGFNSKGPLGAVIQKDLEGYLKAIPNYKNHLSALNQVRSNVSVEAMQKKALLAGSWTKWITAKSKVYAFGAALQTRAECSLYAKESTNDKKMLVISDLLNSDRRWEYIFEIEQTLELLEYQSSQGEARRLWTELRNREDIKNDFLSKLPYLDSTILIKNSLLKLALKIGWIDNKEFDQQINQTLNFLLSSPLSLDDADQICSSGLQREILPEWLRQEGIATLKALSCLQPKSEKVRLQLAQKLVTALASESAMTRLAAQAGLMGLKPQDDQVQGALAALILDPRDAVAGSAALTSSQLFIKNKKITDSLVYSLRHSGIETRRMSAMALKLLNIKLNDQQINSILEGLEDVDTMVRVQTCNILKESQSQNAKVHESLKRRLSDTDRMVRSSAIDALGSLFVHDNQTIQELSKALEDSELIVRMSAEDALIRFNVSDKSIRQKLEKIQQIRSNQIKGEAELRLR